MKICVAQLKPIKGDIAGNIEKHKKLIELAVSQEADLIIFPELSLTGYEPLAKVLSIHPDDKRLDDFQKISDTESIIIGVGVPTKNEKGICISILLFHPHQSRQLYSKQYLHPDEESYFVKGKNLISHIKNKPNISLAICYELSISEHSEQAYKNGANIYIASVAKSASGVTKATQRLSMIAKRYSMTVFMSNSIGLSDDFTSAGQSSIWNSTGKLLAQLNSHDEGLLLLDTHSNSLLVTKALRH